VRVAGPFVLAVIAASAVAAGAFGCGSSKNGSSFTSGPEGGSGDAAAASDVGTLCAHDDCDGDGYSPPADCNDTDPRVNPEAYDFKGDNVDNDCDGAVDNPVETCETIPAQSPGTPADFARAADLCAQRAMTSSGAPFDPLIKAEWGSVKGYGSGQRIWKSVTKMQQVDIVSSFGSNAPRVGATMVGMANGPWGTKTPRESPALDDPGFNLGDACADIPLTGTDCDSLTAGQTAGHGVSVQDWAELTLWVKVPSNAQTMVFDFAFFTTEFNQFWNAALNDAFFVLVSSSQLHGENVAHDASGLAITVNSGFFQLCPKPPGPIGLSSEKAAALAHCVGVDGDPSQSVFGTLKGTGYDGAASSPFDGTALSTDGTKKYVYGGGSGWLTAKLPVTPSEELTMRIIVHDTFDGLKDSSVLVDAMRWEPSTAPGGVQRPPPK
jgi:hypothetical protein